MVKVTHPTESSLGPDNRHQQQINKLYTVVINNDYIKGIHVVLEAFINLVEKLPQSRISIFTL